MLKKIHQKLFRRGKLELNITITPDEVEGMKIVLKSAEEVAKEKLREHATTGIALGGGVEASRALGGIAFKTMKDVSRGDYLCTGFCIVSGTCETVALGCSTIPIIPFRGKMYVGAKIISVGCMQFRNMCAGEGC